MTEKPKLQVVPGLDSRRIAGTVVLALCAVVGCSGATSDESSTVRRDEANAVEVIEADGDHDSPQEVFIAAQAAAEENDFARVISCHTIETQEGLLTHTVLAAAMMRLVADKLAERGDNRYAESKRKIDGILEKFGVDLSRVSEADLQPGNPDLKVFRELASTADDRLNFLAQLLSELESAKGSATTGFQDVLRGDLIDVEIRDEQATGFVTKQEDGRQVREPMTFRRTKAGWRIHMPPD